MVEGNTADGGEAAQVVFVGIVEAVPGDDVEGCMVLSGSEEVAVEFGQDLVGGAGVFVEGGNGGLEVPRVGQTIRTDGTKLGELEVSLVKLEDVTSDGAMW